MRKISNRRKEMGEKNWEEYQKQRIKKKSHKHYLKHMYNQYHWRGNIKRQLIDHKGGKCEVCGYNKPFLSVYCFHHINPKEKDFGISGMKWKLEKLKKEANKCLLLCHNCHNELHEKQFNEKRKNTE